MVLSMLSHGYLLLIILPSLNLKVLDADAAEGFDEGRSEAGVGHKRGVVVDCSTTDLVTVGQLA